MLQKRSWKDGLVVLVLVAGTALGGYLYANPDAAAHWWQKLYPLRAQAALSHMHCSPGSPAWMADALRQLTRQHNALANQVAYISPSGQTHHCESGYTDEPWLSPPVTPSSRFRYASVSKLWTADAILQLANQGRLSLDDKLIDHLPPLPPLQDPRVGEITLAQLLRHQAGFDRHSIFGEDMFTHGKQPWCPADLSQLAASRLAFDPGSKSSYSNLGYCLLGEVVAHHSGTSFIETIERQYHLKADDIRFLAQYRFADEVVSNHVETGLTGVGDVYTAFDYPALASSAGLSGNALALARQLRTMLAHPGLTIVSQPAGEACTETEGESTCYGYAMSPYRPEAKGLKLFVRSGVLLGMASLAVVDEHGGITVLLSNGRVEQAQPSVPSKQKMVYRALQQHYQTSQQ